MNGNNLSQKIISKIKESHLKPTPKWKFLLHNYLIWLLFVLSVLLGALATAVAIFVVAHSDYQVLFSYGGAIKQLLLVLPYFWLMLLLIFILFSHYYLKHTSKGYRFNPIMIVLFSMVLSMVLGFMIYAVGGGGKLEQIFYHNVPIYQNLMHYRIKHLSMPERGMLPGDFIGYRNVDEFDFKDFNGAMWLAIWQKDATMRPALQPGMRIILLGRPISGDQFEVSQVKTFFRGMGGGMGGGARNFSPWRISN